MLPCVVCTTSPQATLFWLSDDLTLKRLVRLPESVIATPEPALPMVSMTTIRSPSTIVVIAGLVIVADVPLLAALLVSTGLLLALPE